MQLEGSQCSTPPGSLNANERTNEGVEEPPESQKSLQQYCCTMLNCCTWGGPKYTQVHSTKPFESRATKKTQPLMHVNRSYKTWWSNTPKERATQIALMYKFVQLESKNHEESRSSFTSPPPLRSLHFTRLDMLPLFVPWRLLTQKTLLFWCFSWVLIPPTAKVQMKMPMV